GDVVARSGVKVIAVRGLARAPEAPPRDGDDMKTIGELVGKRIVHVRVVSHPREQHQGLPGAAPVQHFQLDLRFDRDESYLVAGVIEATGVVRCVVLCRRTGRPSRRGWYVQHRAAETCTGDKTGQSARSDQ